MSSLDAADARSWVEERIHRSVVVAVPDAGIGDLLRLVPASMPSLRHVRAVYRVGDRVTVDLVAGPVRREFSVVVDDTHPHCVAWSAATSRGSFGWCSVGRRHSLLEVEVCWNPDSISGLLLALTRIDRVLIASEVRRLAAHLERVWKTGRMPVKETA